MRLQVTFATAIFLAAISVARAAEPTLIAPLYIEYTSASDKEFAAQVEELRRRIGEPGPNILVGFSAFLGLRVRDPQLNKPIDQTAIEPTLADIDLMVNRAQTNHIPLHISVVSNFFHGNSSLRETAIREDVRNAQWFADGWIALPEEIQARSAVPKSAWITPSRYAQPLRQRIEESARITGKHLAEAMEKFPGALISISGDSEVEFSYERNLDGGERPLGGPKIFYTDYSPFMVAEFRDWLRDTRYAGDRSPATDDNRDGHTLNRDFHQQFRTWDLRYFNDSGPIPYEQYRGMPQKLPLSGRYFIEGGFDAPREAAASDAFWQAWKAFRTRVIANYLRDFGAWITDDSRIPASRFYTHQIPADYVFAGKNGFRLETSASPLETAFLPRMASAGVTVFDAFNGRSHVKTSNSAMFQRLEKSGAWGILEYNPSVPAVDDETYYLTTLRALYAFHPTIIAPFAWTNNEQHKQYQIQGTAFARALKKFIEENQNR